MAAKDLPLMAFDVFISYSSNDTIAANAICSNLESQGVRCWIAPRDVRPGWEWPKAIVEAIAGCKLLVLVFSASSNDSLQTRKEVDCAISHEKTIIPFRIEDVIPTGSMEYYLGDLHWLDALTPPLEAHIRQLTQHIKAILSAVHVPEGEGPVTRGGMGRREPAPKKNRLGALRKSVFGPRRGRVIALSDFQAARNRKAMLDLVKNIWIKGILVQRLNTSIQVEIGMESRLEAVANRPHAGTEGSRRENGIYPSGSRLLDIFREWNGELLLLGDPGSGKTTAMLMLARDLLEAANTNAFEPIPVVFNLSSWSEKRRDLDEWLVEELVAKYNIPTRIARIWIDNDELLLLLDGLDEVRREHRSACVRAINRFKSQHLVPMVVSSRTADYEEQKEKLNLRGAQALLPISPQYFDQLEFAGQEDRARLVRIFESDPTLKAFAQTPLMLNVIAMTYRSIRPEELEKLRTPEEHRAYILQAFIRQKLQGKQAEKKYPAGESMYWLSRLAGFLKLSNQTIFLEEQMQPSWLGGRLGPLVYLLFTRIAGSLLVGVFPLLWNPAYGVIKWGNIIYLPILVLLGLAVGLLDAFRLLVVRKIPKQKILKGLYAIAYLILLGIVIERISAQLGDTSPVVFLSLLFLFVLKGGGSGLQGDIRILKSITFKGRRFLLCVGVGVLLWALTAGFLLMIREGWRDKYPTASAVQVWNSDGYSRAVMDVPGLGVIVEEVPGASRLITRNTLGQVDLWDLSGRHLSRPAEDASNILVSPDGERMVIQKYSGPSAILDKDGIILGEFPRYLQIKAILPEGDLLVGENSILPRTVGLWDWEGQSVEDLQAGSFVGLMENDGKTRILTVNDGDYRLWDRAGNLFQLEKTPTSTSAGNIGRLFYNNRKKLLAFAFRDGSAGVWDSDGHLLQSYSVEERVDDIVLDSSESTILLIRYRDMDTEFRLLTTAGAPAGDFRLSGNWSNSWIQFSPDGRYIALNHGSESWIWDTFTQSIHPLSFNGRLLMVIGWIRPPDQTINLLWVDVERDLHAWTLDGLETARFSLDGSMAGVFIAPSMTRFASVRILQDPSIETLGNRMERVDIWSPDGALLSSHAGLISGSDSVRVFFDSRGEILGATFPPPQDYSTLALLWIVLGMMVGVILSLQRQSVDSRIVVSQGIPRTARNALFIGAIAFVLTMTVFFFMFVIIILTMGVPSDSISDTFIALISISLYVAIPVMGGWGGLDVLYHYLLRLLLWAQGVLPGRLIQFLDFAAERAMLRKVGGGYMFLHPTIQEHFFSLPVEQPVPVRRRWLIFRWAILIGVVLLVVGYSLPIISRMRSDRAVYLDRLANQVSLTDSESAYQYALQAASLVPDKAGYLNGVCWFGSLADHAAQVLETCNKAVSMNPLDGAIRDSRGLARALTGDNMGAIDDFQYFIDWSEQDINSIYREDAQKRKPWIEKMKNGQLVDHQAIIQDLR